MRVSSPQRILRIIPPHTLVIVPSVIFVQTTKPIHYPIGQHLVLVHVGGVIFLRVVVLVVGSVEVVASCDFENGRDGELCHDALELHVDLFVVEVLAQPTVTDALD